MRLERLKKTMKNSIRIVGGSAEIRTGDPRIRNTECCIYLGVLVGSMRIRKY
jgi:hypothetical protein